MAKRPGEDLESDENRAVVPAPKRPAPSLPKGKTSMPLYRASIKDVADAAGAGADKGHGKAGAKVEAAILERIKKCLSRANHHGTPEAEAKAALLIANKLMGQYNVSQAEVLAHESAETRQQYAGESVVAIKRTDGNLLKRVQQQAYLGSLVGAITRFFDVRCFTAARIASLDIVFYGIGANTVSAAYSFEMVYNQVNEWAMYHKGGNPRNSYLLGISESLLTMSREAQQLEEKRAREAEEATLAAREKEEQNERQAQLDRLAPLSRSPSVEMVKEQKVGDPKMKQEPDVKCEPDGEERPSATEKQPDLKSDDDTDSDNENDPWNVGAHNDDDDDILQPDFNLDDIADLDPFADLDEEMQRLIKTDANTPGTPLVPKSESESESESGAAKMATNAKKGTQSTPSGNSKTDTETGPQWASHMQLVAFRDTALQIADSYVAHKGMKLSRRNVKTSVIRDGHAYAQGQLDGKKIDVRGNRIKEA